MTLPQPWPLTACGQAQVYVHVHTYMYMFMDTQISEYWGCREWDRMPISHCHAISGVVRVSNIDAITNHWFEQEDRCRQQGKQYTQICCKLRDPMQSKFVAGSFLYRIEPSELLSGFPCLVSVCACLLFYMSRSIQAELGLPDCSQSQARPSGRRGKFVTRR